MPEILSKGARVFNEFCSILRKGARGLRAASRILRRGARQSDQRLQYRSEGCHTLTPGMPTLANVVMLLGLDCNLKFNLKRMRSNFGGGM